MAFTQRPSRRAPVLPISLEPTCIECKGEPRSADQPCPRCWGMTRSEQIASVEETRRLLSAAFTEGKTA